MGFYLGREKSSGICSGGMTGGGGRARAKNGKPLIAGEEERKM